MISISDFDYELPDELIARHPLAQRDRCRLLTRHPDGSLSDHTFFELPRLLPPDALLVYNNTRVINARLRFRKGADRSGALIEIFCLEPVEPADYARNFASDRSCSWLCLVGNSKRWKEEPLTLPLALPDGRTFLLTATRIDRRDDMAGSVVRFSWDNPAVTFSEIISLAGEIPIPPYLNRPTEDSDAEDYQTVFSHIQGSVAAPTAGLHFTPELLLEIDRAGIKRREVTLHVGAGTFRPVKSEDIAQHVMHSEFFVVKRPLVEELMATDNPVVAVGTTSVRTLESLYHAGCLISQGRWDGRLPQWYPYSADHPRLSVRQSLDAILQYLDAQRSSALFGSTGIIIAPGYEYRIVKAIITNFHQPRSTLLLLISSFIDRPRTDGLSRSPGADNPTDWRAMYRHALESEYRFLSYGDACLLL